MRTVTPPILYKTKGLLWSSIATKMLHDREGDYTASRNETYEWAKATPQCRRAAAASRLLQYGAKHIAGLHQVDLLANVTYHLVTRKQ